MKIPPYEFRVKSLFLYLMYICNKYVYFCFCLFSEYHLGFPVVPYATLGICSPTRLPRMVGRCDRFTFLPYMLPQFSRYHLGDWMAAYSDVLVMPHDCTVSPHMCVMLGGHAITSEVMVGAGA